VIEPMTEEELRAARELDAARTPGEWQWFGNVKQREVYLATADRGRVFVMQFDRWGMQGGQPRFQVRLDDQPGSGVMRDLDDLGPVLGPKMIGSHRNDFVGIGHPDARFVAAASTLVPRLLSEVDRLRAEVARLTAERDEAKLEADASGVSIWRLNLEVRRDTAEIERLTKLLEDARSYGAELFERLQKAEAANG
jgi:hypothetical protein